MFTMQGYEDMYKGFNKHTPYGFHHFTNHVGDILEGFVGLAKFLLSSGKAGLPRFFLLLKVLLQFCIFLWGSGKSSLKIFYPLLKISS